jgi:hypothetical protein
MSAENVVETATVVGVQIKPLACNAYTFVDANGRTIRTESNGWAEALFKRLKQAGA